MLFRSSTTTIATTPHGMIYQSAPKPGFLLPEVTEASIIAYTIDRNHTWIYGVMLISSSEEVRPKALSHWTGCSKKKPASPSLLVRSITSRQVHHFSTLIGHGAAARHTVVLCSFDMTIMAIGDPLLSKLSYDVLKFISAAWDLEQHT
ncbi:hypothetical protein JB92DRAFT_2831228 [Gautieria morchelliformis]|nr:hypothetical protein JB92DRAFT_2831228 [Gautieria morchelliformis]